MAAEWGRANGVGAGWQRCARRRHGWWRVTQKAGVGVDNALRLRRPGLSIASLAPFSSLEERLQLALHGVFVEHHAITECAAYQDTLGTGRGARGGVRHINKLFPGLSTLGARRIADPLDAPSAVGQTRSHGLQIHILLLANPHVRVVTDATPINALIVPTVANS